MLPINLTHVSQNSKLIPTQKLHKTTKLMATQTTLVLTKSNNYILQTFNIHSCNYILPKLQEEKLMIFAGQHLYIITPSQRLSSDEISNAPYNYQVALFLKILNGLLANGHSLWEIIARKRIKHIIMSCID